MHIMYKFLSKDDVLNITFHIHFISYAYDKYKVFYI